MDKELIAAPVDRLVCSQCGREIEVAGREAFSTIPCPHCYAPQTIPALLGSFLLLERMGSGGMGAVYRGLDTTLNRYVAVKVMKPALGEDARLVDSFIREARSAAALNHRNIVQIYSCGQENGQPFIVMELVTGGKMNHLFSPTEPMDEVKLLKIAMDVAEGLKAANEVGLVHGDIKPENILIDQSGTAKIVDFGLAQFVNAQKERGEIWGTPYYISPERARGNKADHRSDIYSLGATMFHALTGEPPFDGPTPVDVVLARLKHPPPNLLELRPGLQKETAALIERMMAVDPYLRYPNSASLRADMHAALETAKAVKAKAKEQQTAGKKIKRIAILAAVVVAALGLAGVAYWRLRPPEEKPVRPPKHAEPKAKKSQPPNVEAPEEPEEIVVTRSKVKDADGKAREVVTVRVFPPDEEAALAEAILSLAVETPLDAQRRLDAFGKKLPRGSLRAMWIPLLESASFWLANDSRRAEAALDTTAKFIIRKPEEHAAFLPQMLAKRLMNKMEDASFAGYAGKWPAWYADLGELLAGFQALNRGQADVAIRAFDRFLAQDRDRPAWCAAFRPIAEKSRIIALDAQEVRNQITRLLEDDQPAAARAVLDAFRLECPHLFSDMASQMRSQIEAHEQKAKAVRAEAAGRAHRRLVQADLDAVEHALSDQAAAIMRTRDFRRAALSVATLPSDMKTTEGREAAVWLRESFDRLESLKSFLIRGIEGRPFTRADGSDLGGDIVNATGVGVRVALDGRLIATHNWENVSARTLVRMGEFYAGQPGVTEKERAEVLSALALFSLLNGAFEPALNYAEAAATLQPGLDKQIRRLIPGLLSGDAIGKEP